MGPIDAQFKSTEELREIDLEYCKGRSGGDEDRHWMGVALFEAEAAGLPEDVVAHLSADSEPAGD